MCLENKGFFSECLDISIESEDKFHILIENINFLKNQLYDSLMRLLMQKERASLFQNVLDYYYGSSASSRLVLVGMSIRLGNLALLGSFSKFVFISCANEVG